MPVRDHSSGQFAFGITRNEVRKGKTLKMILVSNEAHVQGGVPC
jgi:hypothetical protein